MVSTRLLRLHEVFTNNVAHSIIFLSIVSELFGFLIAVLCFFWSFKMIEGNSFIVISSSKIGIETDGVIKGSHCLLMAREVVESHAFIDPFLSRLQKVTY